MPHDDELRHANLEAVELRLKAEMGRLVREEVERATQDRREIHRRTTDQIAELRKAYREIDQMLRGDGRHEPGVVATLAALEKGQRRRESLEKAGLLLLAALFIERVWDLITRVPPP